MSLFGRFYRVFTFGQSHAAAVGCVVQGFPSNFPICLQQVQQELNRRKPGQSHLSTPRKEQDIVTCISGLQNGLTLGSPLCFLVHNQDVKKQDYQAFNNVPRPGHADFTYMKKYGIKAASGGGRSSARQTIGRVIAGAISKQYLRKFNIDFASWVYSVGNNHIPDQINRKFVKQKLTNTKVEELGQICQKNGEYRYMREKNIFNFNIQNGTQILSRENIHLDNFSNKMPNIRCPHQPTAIKIMKDIQSIKKQQDSLGGIIQGCIYNMPKGLGEPVFDKIQALMAHAMLSIPATKGFQFGSGFKGTSMKGSQHNDMFNSDLTLKTNYSGGSLGGISTGETFEFKVAFKPVSTIGRTQQTSNWDGKMVQLQGKGRHDPCVLPRAPPIVDNMAAIVVMQLLLSQNATTNKY